MNLSLNEERSAEDPHATFCGSRRWGAPALWGRVSQSGLRGPVLLGHDRGIGAHGNVLRSQPRGVRGQLDRQPTKQDKGPRRRPTVSAIAAPPSLSAGERGSDIAETVRRRLPLSSPGGKKGTVPRPPEPYYCGSELGAATGGIICFLPEGIICCAPGGIICFPPGGIICCAPGGIICCEPAGGVWGALPGMAGGCALPTDNRPIKGVAAISNL